MFAILLSLLVLLRLHVLVLLHKAAQHPHLLLQVAHKVEIIELPQTKLAIIVVQTLLRNSNKLSSVLQIESAIERLMAIEV